MDPTDERLTKFFNKQLRADETPSTPSTAASLVEAVGTLIGGLFVLCVALVVFLIPFALIAAAFGVMVIVFRWLTGI